MDWQPIETAPTEGEFLAEDIYGDWARVTRFRHPCGERNLVISHRRGRWWRAERWTAIPSADSGPPVSWRPIETAPMDGETYVLIYEKNEDGTPWIDVARWYEGEWLDRMDHLSTEAPTHWAPLVAPARED